MIKLLLVLMSAPVMAQNTINSRAILEKISPVVSELASPAPLFEKSAFPSVPHPVQVGYALRLKDGPLINDQLWDSLKPASPVMVSWLLKQVPDLDPSQIKAMPLSAIERVARAAIVAHDNSLAFMTDPGLTTPHVFYLSREVCAALFSKYDFGAITIDSGITGNGRKFQIQAMLVGNNKIQVIYNIDHFEFKHPQYPQYPFILSRLVTYTINGPGDLSVSGIKADAGIVHATIQDIEDARNGYLQIDTDYGQQFVKSSPISVISLR